MQPYLQFCQYRINLDKPLVMAIINVTPDSFSGDGLDGNVAASLARARQAIDEGADILDVGGESSRPGSEAVPLDEELRRVVPVVEALAELGVPVSVDTTKPEVMRAVIEAGAVLINDINGLRSPGAIDAVASSDCGVCLMHMRGVPRAMQQAPSYENVVAEVVTFLDERVAAVRSAGVAPERIVIDPGFGFGKTLEHNVALFRALSEFGRAAPLLIGVSRKSMIGEISGRPIGERSLPSVVAAIAAAARGASILRVHDVADTVMGLRVWKALGVGASPTVPARLT